MEIIKLLNNGSKILKDKNIASHILDSEILLSKTLNKTREQLLSNLNIKIDKKKIYQFKKLINRRSLSEPVAYILKQKEFWSKKFHINKDTLIPRPETEMLVEEIIKIFKRRKTFILDIGTGSGCILLSLLSELKKSKGIGIDKSARALNIAIKNAKQFKLINRVKFYPRSLSDFHNIKFDLIVSNPPYIMRKDIKYLKDDIKKFEPELALDGGNDGLDVIKKVIYKSRIILKIKGMLALEIGNGQFKKVSKILKENKFRTKYLVKDYRENIRCIISSLEKWDHKYFYSMNNNRRRSFRPRPQKNNFRRRNGSMSSNNGGNFNNGNLGFSRNGSMTNPHNIEKTVQKFQQLAKDAQSNGDTVLVENYLQHADHYSRRLAELSERNKDNSKIEKNNSSTDKSSKEVTKTEEEIKT